MLSLISSKQTAIAHLSLRPLADKTTLWDTRNVGLRNIQKLGSLFSSLYTRQNSIPNTKKSRFLLIAIPLALAIFPLAVIGHLLLTQPKKINT